MFKIFKLFWILFFWVGSILPLFYINTDEVTHQENRTLAKFPKINKQGTINTNFGVEFESWLGDHFAARDKLINTRFHTIYKINGRIENDKAFIGDDGWIFLTAGTKKVPPLKWQQEDATKKVRILRDFISLFQKKEVTFFVLFLPDKNEIYQKYWERYYLPRPKWDYEKEFEKGLSDLSNVFMVKTKQIMIDNAEKEHLFWKDDVHFSPAGMQLFFMELYRQITLQEAKKIPSPTVELRNIEKFHHVASTAAYLGLPGQVYAPYSYHYFSFKSSGYFQEGGNKFKEIKQSLWEGEHFLNRFSFAKNPILDKKLISIAPCYGENIYNFLRPLYRESYWIRTNIGLGYGQEAYDLNKRKIKEILNSNGSLVIVLTFCDEKMSFEMLEDIVKEVKNGHF